MGDLREEYARRVAGEDLRGVDIARSWYRREALAIGVRYAAIRLGRRMRRPAPSAAWLERLSCDFAAAGRSLRRDPAFMVATAGLLAIGIGAVTAAFTLVDRVLLEPLPFADENRIVSIYEADVRGTTRLLSYPTFRDWRPEAKTFEGLAFVRGERLGVGGPEGRWLLAASYGTPELFAVMRAQPVLGRVFEEADVRAPVAVLAWHTWREQFGGADVIGRMLSTDHGPVTVIGVMPENVRYPAWSDLWLPLSALPPRSLEALERRDLRADSGVVGRIRDGVTLDRAALELSALAKRAADARPHDSRGWTRVVQRSLRDELIGAEPTQLLVLAIAAGALLLIAAANVAGLLVARTAARRHEIALRAALGAPRRYLAGPFAAESLIIALIGGTLGAALAMGTVRLLANAVPDVLPRLEGAAVDGRALVVAAAASILSALAFALLMARRAARVQPAWVLRNEA
ncbi:MAG: ABC transporter permease [Longimicrobiales bacterium]